MKKVGKDPERRARSRNRVERMENWKARFFNSRAVDPVHSAF